MSLIDFDGFPLALAPLAGFTDLPFRQVAKRFGVDVTVSEMISANALVYGSKKTFSMLQKSPSETPYIVQLAGSDPAIIKAAVEILNDIDGIDGIDLNCGCPVPKVLAQNSGSSLLQDLPKLRLLLETIKLHSTKCYTSAKVRIGFSQKTPVDIAKAVNDSGVDFMSIHGRTRSGGYHAPVDYDAIRAAKEVVNIPVFANGDITDANQALHVKNYTGCEGVMIGRGAVGAPWIFHQIKHAQSSPEAHIIHQVVMEHFDAMVSYHGPYGSKLFRKHLHTYSKGFAGASAFRDTINREDDHEKARQIVDEFFKPKFQ
jgi:tRNA-dihydrouridine synthase B